MLLLFLPEIRLLIQKKALQLLVVLVVKELHYPCMGLNKVFISSWGRPRLLAYNIFLLIISNVIVHRIRKKQIEHYQIIL
jgi:hypothetical protein